MEDIVQRLRGQYSVGPHEPNGSPEFGWRQFQATPINLEAADEIERLRTQLKDAQLPTAADVRGIMAPDDQRVAMPDPTDRGVYLSRETSDEMMRALVNSLHGQIFGVVSFKDPAHSHAQLEDGGEI